MSGGVDSTATALFLKSNYEIKGFFMRLAQPDLQSQEARVQLLAEQIGIELEIIDLSQQFNRVVLNYFSSSYFAGLTPNPCVICNREIKFGLFLQAILDRGMDKMATGHYARLEKRKDAFHLHMGKDPRKDQTYFLSRLHQNQLAHILFPLGEMTKEEIYDYVESHGFRGFRGNESQDVCFLGETSVGNYLQGLQSKTPQQGAIVDQNGKVLGHHSGLCQYTIGQRKGLGISSDRPLYVVGLDPQTNNVIVGDNEALFQQTLLARDFHWLEGAPPPEHKSYTVRIRYTHRGATARLTRADNNSGILHFEEPQRAITPGQFAVLYDGDELLGSGIITGGRK